LEQRWWPGESPGEEAPARRHPVYPVHLHPVLLRHRIMAGGANGVAELLPKVLESFRKADPAKAGVISQAQLGTVLRRCAGKSGDEGALEPLSDENLQELVTNSKAGDGKGGVAYERLIRWLWVPGPKSESEADQLGAQLSTIAAIMPYEQTTEALARRKEYWKKWDLNRNGKLSLAEFEKGILDDLVDPITGGDKGEARQILRTTKPAVSRAYAIAREVYSLGDPKAVDFQEFRPLLGFLCQYLEMLRVFAAADSSNDKRLQFEEFQAALPDLQRWGGFAVPAGEEEKIFSEAAKGGKNILFDDFCKWVMAKHVAGFEKDKPLEGDDL